MSRGYRTISRRTDQGQAHGHDARAHTHTCALMCMNMFPEAVTALATLCADDDGDVSVDDTAIERGTSFTRFFARTAICL